MPSHGAGIALRLIQVHFAIIIVTSGLHKLQFGDWWSGVAYWYPLHPPFEVTRDSVRQQAASASSYLGWLSAVQYAALGWQLAFPLFAWKRSWRIVLIGGGVLSWIGSVWIYRQPLFGPLLLIVCLSYLTPEEWRRLLSWRVRNRVRRELRVDRSRVATAVLTACLLLSLMFMLGCAPDQEPTPSGRESVERIGLPSPHKSEPLPEVSGSLKQRVSAAMRHVRSRDLLTTNSFWTIFHGILGVGPDVPMLDPLTKQRITAVDHICRGGQVRGLQFIPTAHGLDVQTGPISVGQGHQDQFIAEMAQWGMKADQPFRVHGKEYTFMDFVKHSQKRVQVTARQELSWAILIIAQYLGTDAEWINEHDEKLTLEDVVRYELNQPIDEAACGGTHRLFGLTWAYHLHLARGGQKTAVWNDVEAKIANYVQRARKTQNADGSFSTRYLAGAANAKDLDLRVNTTGHVVEWLALALSDAELRQGWVQEAVNALVLMILDSASRPIDSGSLYHANHGLHLYHARVWGRSEVTHPGLLYPLPPR